MLLLCNVKHFLSDRRQINLSFISQSLLIGNMLAEILSDNGGWFLVDVPFFSDLSGFI